jgi:hypothetical protein
VTAEKPPAKAVTPNAHADPCPPPTENEPRLDFDPKPLRAICHGVYVDPAMGWEERELVKTSYVEAHAAVADFFGAPVEMPSAIVCSTDACAETFAGPTRRSRATLEPRPTVIIGGLGPLTKGTLVHEMIHVETALRLRKEDHHVPTWFDEGVATYIGDSGRCTASTPRAVDDLRRLEHAWVWTNFTNQPDKIGPTYCQARDEVAAWSKTHGRKALVGVIDAVARGESFEANYGPLAIPPEGPAKGDLVASFTLDDKAGKTATDASHHLPPASLAPGATWTAGHHGGGVNVTHGAFVRASGLDVLGLPNTPFSVSLWVKPHANRNVLVHSAMLPNGTGWCIPILGHDRSGHLVAQVPFHSKPDAFLSAIGPTLAIDAWSHVVMTWADDDGVRLYVNGKLAASRTPKNDDERRRDAPGSAMHLFFGGEAGASCWAGAMEQGDWSGVLDEIRVYDRPLRAEEVATEAKR